MGIKEGFWSYFSRSELNELLLEQVSSNSTLLIDGSSFMFNIMNQCIKEGGEPIDRRYCGSYAEMRSIICREIKFLQNLGLQLKVYFDGKSSAFKAFEAEDRSNKKDRRWNDFHKIINFDYKLIDQVDLPLPSWTRIFFELVLRQESIEIIKCEVEADLILGKDCKEQNKIHKNCYIYSEDSDFAVMPDCPMIKFGAFMNCNPNSHPYNVTVWRNTTVAACLGLTPAQFIEFVIVVGCDFTVPYNREDYCMTAFLAEGNNNNHNSLFHLQETTGKGYRTFIEILRIFKTLPKTIRVTSHSNPELELAIRFSRAFYNLDFNSMKTIEVERITRDQLFKETGLEESDLLDDSADTESIDSDDDEENDSHEIRLTESIESECTSYIQSLNVSVPVNVHLCADYALQYMQYNLNMGYDPDQIEYIPYIELKHIEVLRQMLVELHDGAVRPESSSDENNDPPYTWAEVVARNAPLLSTEALQHSPEPSWADIYAGCVYQDLVVYIFKNVYNLENAQLGRLEQLYDGRTYFILLSKYENMQAPQLEGTGASIAQETDLPQDPEAHLLPIERAAKKAEILAAIEKHRVVVVNGETGCGKSTRLPYLLYETALQKGEACRVLVSEPHRMAAKKLYDHIHSKHSELIPNLVSLKLGRGGSEGPEHAHITYATAGYIFNRYTQHIKEAAGYTHIILDEVHERSVDNDLVFMIVKQLLHYNPSLKVILMSATPHDNMFQAYFNCEIKQVEVQTRQFETTYWYLEDMHYARPDDPLFQGIFTKRFEDARDQLCKYFTKLTNGSLQSIVSNIIKKQIQLAADIVRTCEKGTAVLVFVTGLAEINLLEQKLKYNWQTVKCVPIHSQLSEGDEVSNLNSLNPDHITVYIATNAAESSITLPTVNVVIDLGTFNEEQNDSAEFARITLKMSWISKPSAKQRAGRTGRVRNGTVYRLYTREAHDSSLFADRNEPSIRCKPLHDVVVRVLGSLGNYFTYPSIAALLEDLIEAPRMDSLQKSLDYLLNVGMISSSDPSVCRLTPLGTFASLLPMSTHLSRLVSFGIRLGLGGFAVILSVILGRKLTRPFRLPIAMYSNPDDYNDQIRKVFESYMKLDHNSHSEPIMLLRLYLHWDHAGRKGIKSMSEFVDPKKMTLIEKEAIVLKQRVNAALVQLNSPEIDFEAELQSCNINPSINQLRYLLLWCGEKNILTLSNNNSTKLISRVEYSSILVKNPALTEMKMRELFVKGDISSIKRSLARFVCVGKQRSDTELIRLSRDVIIRLLHIHRVRNITAVWLRVWTSTGIVFLLGTYKQESLEEMAFLLNRERGVENGTGNTVHYATETIKGSTYYTYTQEGSCWSYHDLDKALHLLHPCSIEIYLLNEHEQELAQHVFNVHVKLNFCISGGDTKPNLKAMAKDIIHLLGALQPDTNVFCTSLSNQIQVCFPWEPVGYHPATRDIPTGMRLLNAYSRHSQNRNLLVSTYDAVHNRARREWFEVSNPKKTGIQGRYASWELLDPTVAAETAEPLHNNEAHNYSFDEQVFVPAVIDKYSYLHHSIPQSEGKVFAVANTVVPSIKGDRTLIMCDQVTIIPYSETWLVAALSCVDTTWRIERLKVAKICQQLHTLIQRHVYLERIDADLNFIRLLKTLHDETLASQRS